MIIAYNQNSGRTLIFNNLEEAMPHMKAVCDRAPNTKWYVGEITGTYGMPVQIQPEFRPGYDGPQRDKIGRASCRERVSSPV